MTTQREVERLFRKALKNPDFRLVYIEDANWYEGSVINGFWWSADDIDNFLSLYFKANCVTYAVAGGGIIIVFDKILGAEIL